MRTVELATGAAQGWGDQDADEALNPRPTASPPFDEVCAHGCGRINGPRRPVEAGGQVLQAKETAIDATKILLALCAGPLR
jgi:hypothetical protein